MTLTESPQAADLGADAGGVAVVRPSSPQSDYTTSPPKMQDDAKPGNGLEREKIRLATEAGTMRRTRVGADTIFHTLRSMNANSDFRVADEFLLRLAAGDTYVPQASKPLLSTDPLTWAKLANIIPSVEWQWKPWLPRGLLTLLVGMSGCGKSALALSLASAVVKGTTWPDGTPGPGGGLVLWAETEAAQAVNLERARLWELPLDRIITPDLGDPLDDLRLDDDKGFSALEAAARKPNVQLIVVDSLRGAFRGDENSSDCVALLTKLAGLARDTNLPLLVIHHLRKRGLFDSEAINLDRVRGSSVITQLARVVWALDRPDPLLPDHVRLSMVKNNLARFPDPIGFEVEAGGVKFLKVAPSEPKKETQTDKACDLLLTRLAQGPVAQKELEEAARGAMISWATMQRAGERLGIVPKHDGKSGKWFWGLPQRE